MAEEGNGWRKTAVIVATVGLLLTLGSAVIILADRMADLRGRVQGLEVRVRELGDDQDTMRTHGHEGIDERLRALEREVFEKQGGRG